MITNTDPLLDTNEAAEYLGRNPKTLANERATKTGPSYIKLGKSVRYRKSVLDAYIERGIVEVRA